MRVAIVLLASTIGFVAASCPNACSGHGRCNKFDQCECFTQSGTAWGQRLMFTGPDCSQRTCPVGIAFGDISTLKDDIDGNFLALDPQRAFDGKKQPTSALAIVKVDTTNYKLGRTAHFEIRILSDAAGTSPAYTAQLQWKERDHDSFSEVLEPGVGIENAVELKNNIDGSDTGIRVYIDYTGYTAATVLDTSGASPKWKVMHANHLYKFSVNYRGGRPYLTGSADSSHQELECSGRGSCDRGTGRCSCYTGFSGEACQRMTCPNSCSGHGVCQELRRFVADANDAGNSINFEYKAPEDGGAYDSRKMMGCLCDAGFRGPDCSQVECPSGADPLYGPGYNGLDGDLDLAPAMDCSGRGICDYSSGVCQCFTGFYGEACTEQTTLV